MIANLKSTFVQHGIHEILISGNGPPYISCDFAQHKAFITSSMYHPRENAEAEIGVQTTKCLLKSNSNLNAVLVSYRLTPLQNGFSPAELFTVGVKNNFTQVA